ncbi:MAG: general secretion pathway protein GspK [Thermodesulfobacteriota bacterium]
MGRRIELGIRNPAIGNRKGVAMIMVLWVIAILSVVVLEFCFGMRTEANIAKNFKEDVQLYAIAEGGVERAIVELIYKHDLRVQQLRRGTKTEEIPPEMKEWLTDGRPYPLVFDQGSCEIRIMAEGGKVNINKVSEATLRKIIGNLGLEAEQRDIVTDSILDWRDPDDLYRINGAENDYYQSLKEPYLCKNDNLDSIEELLLVRGVTPELFYGRKKTLNGEEESKADQAGLKDIFSIYSSGEQIDINSATSVVLRYVLGVPEDVSRPIVKAREEKGFLNQQDLLQRVPEILPFIGEVGKIALYQSITPYYTTESVARSKEGGATRGIKAILKVDPKERKGYKIVQWIDAVGYSTASNPDF